MNFETIRGTDIHFNGQGHAKLNDIATLADHLGYTYPEKQSLRNWCSKRAGIYNLIDPKEYYAEECVVIEFVTSAFIVPENNENLLKEVLGFYHKVRNHVPTKTHAEITLDSIQLIVNLEKEQKRQQEQLDEQNKQIEDHSGRLDEQKKAIEEKRKELEELKQKMEQDKKKKEEEDKKKQEEEERLARKLEEDFEAINKDVEDNKKQTKKLEDDVEDIKDKMKNEDCDEGFMLLDAAHTKFGRGLSRKIFDKVVLVLYKAERKPVTIMESWGVHNTIQVRVEGLEWIIKDFYKGCVRATDKFYKHPRLGNKLFKA